MLPPVRNKVPGWINPGGGLDLAHGSCVATCVLKLYPFSK